MILDEAKDRSDRAQALLDLVGLKSKKDSKLSQLSGGEQQRVAIAIALANHPKILLADEPTGSVDAKTGNYILDVFRKVNEEMGVTVIIVTHDLTLANRVNRVVSIRDGKTSSERIRRRSYLEELQEITSFKDMTEEQQALAYRHEEYAVLDRAGRVQIPKEMLEQIGVTGNRIRLEVSDQTIVIRPEE